MKRDQAVYVPKSLAQDLLRVSVGALPAQAYGLVGGRDLHSPRSAYPCSSNLRNSPEWRVIFDSFGDFYRNPDRGFVISAEEHLAVLRVMRERGETFIGVFHSHRWHGPEPTKADLALHVDARILCYIVSVTMPEQPVLRIYRLLEECYEEIPYEISE